jgi:3'(2'), 5'-bisphosphate nucleotidase
VNSILRLDKETAQAKALAVRAGDILLEHYSDRRVIGWKAPHDPMTSADKAASDFLTEELSQAFPHDSIVCEEQSDDLARLASSRVWFIDPMDGTREFIDHLDEFAVMIGLAIEGTPHLGIIYQPTTRKLYFAARGAGTFLEYHGHTKQLRVSAESSLPRMTVALSRSHHIPVIDRIRDRLGITDVVVCGSFGLKAGLICESRADLCIYPGNNTHQWDTCAPEAIIAEAGGVVTDVNGRPIHYNQRGLRNEAGLIATNGKAHEHIVRITHDVVCALASFCLETAKTCAGRGFAARSIIVS